MDGFPVRFFIRSYGGGAARRLLPKGLFKGRREMKRHIGAGALFESKKTKADKVFTVCGQFIIILHKIFKMHKKKTIT